MGEPPSLAGGVNDTDAELSPATAVTDWGAVGGDAPLSVVILPITSTPENHMLPSEPWVM